VVPLSIDDSCRRRGVRALDAPAAQAGRPEGTGRTKIEDNPSPVDLGWGMGHYFTTETQSHQLLNFVASRHLPPLSCPPFFGGWRDWGWWLKTINSYPYPPSLKSFGFPFGTGRAERENRQVANGMEMGWRGRKRSFMLGQQG
jgi:hypothetical protein